MKNSVLLVEDDTFLAGIYAKKFEVDGFDVAFAANGDDGMKLATKDHPSIILLDLRLQPEKMDGFEMLRQLKADAGLKSIPVLVLTNLGQKEDVERCLKLGAAGYVIKAHALPQEVLAKANELIHANV
jgi:DNA-binding response OmpR family regulator